MTAMAGARRRVAAGRWTVAGGGIAFLAGSALVHLGNYAFNVVTGRLLGPARFGDLAVVVTLLLVVTLVAGTLQTAAAKVATEPGAGATRIWLRRRAAVAGVVAAGALALGSPALAAFFRAASPWPFVLFGLGMPPYFAQAVDRGFLQGAKSFGRLALSYQAEMWSRLGGAVMLVWAGFGVGGAVAALVLSFVASWAVTRPRRSNTSPTIANSGRPQVGAIAGAAAVLAFGEVLVNHSDLIVVKHFADPAIAGAYAAIAVVGRVPFFVAWSVAAVAFPYVAVSRRPGLALRLALWAVAGLGACVTVAAWLASGPIVRVLFGDGYGAWAPYLGPYALAASMFAVAHTAVLLGLAMGRRGGTGLVLGAGLVQAAALWWFHAGISTVVGVQVGVMACLLVAVGAWWRSCR